MTDKEGRREKALIMYIQERMMKDGKASVDEVIKIGGSYHKGQEQRALERRSAIY